MKNTHICPKCKSEDIVRVPGADGVNNIQVGWSIFSAPDSLLRNFSRTAVELTPSSSIGEGITENRSLRVHAISFAMRTGSVSFPSRTTTAKWKFSRNSVRRFIAVITPAR